MKVPHRTGSALRPSAQPLAYLDVQASPGAFGAHIANALGDLGGTMTAYAEKLAENRAQESRIAANSTLAQFEIDQVRILSEMDRDAGPQSGIDTAFSEQFLERANAMIEGAPDEATREYLQTQTTNIYRNLTIQAQGAERQRNANFVSEQLTKQLQQASNIVRADPTQLDAQVEQLATAIAASAGILPNLEIVQRTREALQGVTESAVRAQIEEHPDLVLYQLLHGPEEGGSASLIEFESGGNPTLVNEQGYAGLYQFGAPQLNTIGVYTPGAGENLASWSGSGQWTGTFHIPGFPEVRTLSDFLSNPEAQQAAFAVHTEWMDEQIARLGLDGYIGKTIQGVNITRQGIRNMIHLGGLGGATGFLRGAGNAADANGTTMRDYAMLGSGIVQEAGGLQNILTPQQTERLIGEAQAEMNNQARIAAAEREIAIDGMDTLVEAGRDEIMLGNIPDLSDARQAAVAVGGLEGAAAYRELAFLEQMAGRGAEFMQIGEAGRTEVLNQMATQRQDGLLTPEQIRYHEFYAGLDADLREGAKTRGYETALEHGIIDGPRPLNYTDPGNAANIQVREAQAGQIKFQYGFGASVLTAEEHSVLRAAINSEDPMIAYGVMAQFANAPILQNEIIQALTEENTRDSRTLAIAFDLAGSDRGDEAIAVLRGRAAINGGIDIPSQEKWLQTWESYVGNVFAGLPFSVTAQFQDGAMAHWIGTHLQDVQGLVANINAAQFKTSINAVLPGQVVRYHGWDTLITPTPEIGPEEWGDIIMNLENTPDWWRYARWADPATGQMIPVTEQPTYQLGEPVNIRDITDNGRMVTVADGVYQGISRNSLVFKDGRVLVFDFRGVGTEGLGAFGLEREQQNAEAALEGTTPDEPGRTGVPAPEFGPAAGAAALGVDPPEVTIEAPLAGPSNEELLAPLPPKVDDPNTFTTLEQWTKEDIQGFMTQYNIPERAYMVQILAQRYNMLPVQIWQYLQDLGL